MPNVHNDQGQKTVLRCTKLAGLAAIFSFIILIFVTANFLNPAIKAMVCLWVILPPIFFVYEYHFIYDHNHNEGKNLSLLQYENTVYSKLWASILVIIYLLMDKPL